MTCIHSVTEREAFDGLPKAVERFIGHVATCEATRGLVMKSYRKSINSFAILIQNSDSMNIAFYVGIINVVFLALTHISRHSYPF